MAHTDNSMDALDEVFCEQFLSQGLWPLKLPSLNGYDVYICGMLKEEQTAFEQLIKFQRTRRK
jgi:hypothetical protein